MYSTDATCNRTTAVYHLAGQTASLTPADITTDYAYSTLGQRLRPPPDGGNANTILLVYDTSSDSKLGE